MIQLEQQPSKPSERQLLNMHAEPLEAADAAAWAIRIHDLGKCYRLYQNSRDRIKQWLFGWRTQYYQDIWALRHVSLNVPKGQAVALMGANGSGKSTLLQLLAGTITPTEGTALLQGRVTALLELGSGFHPDFTGAENVRLAACILGLSREELEHRWTAIASMADLGEYLHRPMRTYSSGMTVRLAFALAASVQPEIMLIDEALAVGDLAFQQRCIDRIRQLREQGVTLILVSHDLETCKRLCDVMYVLEKGRIIQAGPSADVADWYFAYLCSRRSATSQQADRKPNLAWEKPGQARIVKVECLNSDGQPVTLLHLGHHYHLRLHVQIHEAISSLIAGFYVRDRYGCEIIGSNTADRGVVFPSLRPGDRWCVDFSLNMRLRPGKYSVSVALANDARQPEYQHWQDHALMLEVIDPRIGPRVHGLIEQDVDIRIHR